MPFSDCRYLVPFRRYSRSKCEVVRNRAEKSMFFGPQIFLLRGPQFLDLVFKIASISNHVAKFRGDRPRYRGDIALNKEKRKKKAAKHKGRVCVITQRAALINISTSPTVNKQQQQRRIAVIKANCRNVTPVSINCRMRTDSSNWSSCHAPQPQRRDDSTSMRSLPMSPSPSHSVIFVNSRAAILQRRRVCPFCAFYRAMHVVLARYCYRKSSVRLSVRL